MKRLAFFATIVLCPVYAMAAPDVFFEVDVQPSGSDFDDIALAGAPAANTNSTNYGAATFIMPGTGEIITVTIDNLDQTGSAVGGIDWRDRGDSSNSGDPLVNLGEDFVKNNGGVVRITFAGLPEGTYDITSYHQDSGFTQSDQIEVHLSLDGNPFIDTGAVGSANPNFSVSSLTTAQVMDGSAMFSFLTDGTGPVAIVFDGRPSADNETPLNGLSFAFTAPQAVPEPASIAIWSLLGLALVGLRYHRIRRK